MNQGPNSEILQIVEAVSREKNIPQDKLIAAMERALETAAKKKYGAEGDIRAEIGKKNGEIKIFRILTVTEKPENYDREISLKEAKKLDPSVSVGDEVKEILPPIEIGRVSAQIAKQIIVGDVAEIEREKQYKDFKDRKGEILNGLVKRIEYGNIIVDLGRTEAVIKKDQLIRGETFKINDRIKAYVQDVRREEKGPQIFLSRADDMMLAKLFELEVPEMYEGVITVQAIARDPGSKSKIAVHSSDYSVDPVMPCVGIRGSRVKAITQELGGEKIDVVKWSDDLAQFVVNAMAPAEISKIFIDEDKRRVEVVVPEDKLSIAIGRGGQNVRLASKLVSYNIDVMTEEEESKRRTTEFKNLTDLYVKTLGLEEVLAQLLCAEGFSSLEQIAAVDLEVLANLDGFSEKIASEIKDKALSSLEERDASIIEKLEKLGVDQELIDLLNMHPEHILILAENGVKTIEDLGELTLREFKELLPDSNLTSEQIKELIRFGGSQGS